MPLPLQPPDECAHCGAEIPRTAKACPECGADERTGWREASPYDGLNLPDDDSDEPGGAYRRQKQPAARVNGVAWYWWIVGIVLLLLFIGGMVGLG
jgi:hypothetical protein